MLVISHSRDFSDLFHTTSKLQNFSFRGILNNTSIACVYVNNTAMNMKMQISLQDHFGYIPRIQLAGSYDSVVFTVVIIFRYISTSNNQAVLFTFI